MDLKKLFVCVLVMFLISCACAKQKDVFVGKTSLNSEMNKSIIDGFFDGDSTKISETTYLLKN